MFCKRTKFLRRTQYFSEKMQIICKRTKFFEGMQNFWEETLHFSEKLNFSVKMQHYLGECNNFGRTIIFCEKKQEFFRRVQYLCQRIQIFLGKHYFWRMQHIRVLWENIVSQGMQFFWGNAKLARDHHISWENNIFVRGCNIS